MKRGFRVLVIEDDEVIRDALRDFLEMEGYTVDTAVHGAQALELLRRSDTLPSLILLDLNMPVMSGKTFLKKIQEQAPTYGKIPIVLMTALPDENIKGVVSVISKPFRLKLLLEQVRSFGDLGQQSPS